MKIIGLTGGIGSGKSTVSAYLSKKGCVIIDADKISRRLTEKGSPYLETIREAFGDGYFDEEGNLERQKLGQYIFANPDKKKLLEGIVTDAVIEKVFERLNTLKNEEYSGIVILDAPLLFECGMQKYADENWLVTADLKTVIQRVKSRDGMSEKDIEGRIAGQMPLEEKKKLADHVIDNSRDLDYLYLQLDREIDRLKNGE